MSVQVGDIWEWAWNGESFLVIVHSLGDTQAYASVMESQCAGVWEGKSCQLILQDLLYNGYWRKIA